MTSNPLADSQEPRLSESGFTLPGSAREVPHLSAFELVNDTPFPSAGFGALDQNAQGFHVVATRITYDMDSLDNGPPEAQALHRGRQPVLRYASEQTPLVDEDAWSAEPNASNPLWESDYAPYKPRCDVLVVNAVTRAPMGDWQRVTGDLNAAPTAKHWRCGIALEWLDAKAQPQTWKKQIQAVGPRRFGLLGIEGPQACSEVPLDWQHAYGGQNEHKPDAPSWNCDERNPVGVGLRRGMGEPLPQLEPVDIGFGGILTKADYPPISLGPLGRAWLPRRALAGTPDDAWLKEQWPLVPQDFNFAYWNCAPADQQTPYLSPGTRIHLVNLYGSQADTKNKTQTRTQSSIEAIADAQSWSACLPARHPCVLWRLESGMLLPAPLHLDTLVIDLKARRIYATHRAVLATSAGVRQADVLLMPWPGQKDHQNG
jgi:hypothetical protein